MAYAAASDMILRYDEKSLIDLATDDADNPPASADCTVVATALADASARVDAALSVAGLYDADAVDAFSDSATALLKMIVCKLAMASLQSRRPEKFNVESIRAAVADAEEYLERLRKGERIFGVTDDASRESAGLVDLDAPDAIELDRRNGILSRAHRAFPNISQRLPNY